MDPSPSHPAAETEPATPARGDAPASPLRAVLAPRWHGVSLLTLGLLAFSLSVLCGNYLPTRATTAATERALAEQRAENRSLAERIRAAEQRALLLERDPWTNERFLRDTLHMSRQGEVLVR